MICPRCQGTSFTEHDCGPDSYEDDIFYISESCDGCGLWYDGWRNKWLIDVASWTEAEDAKEFL